MGRYTGGWLEGPQLQRDEPRGVRLGLPAEGPGSVASFGARLGAYAIDAVVADLTVGLPRLFGAHPSLNDRNWLILGAFLLESLVLVALLGQTIGMRFLGLRVVRVGDRGLQSPGWVLVRTVLLGLLVPALVWDRDGRGMHDRAAGTVVVRDPNRRTRPAPPQGHARAGTGSTAPRPAPSRSAPDKRPAAARPGRATGSGGGRRSP